MINVHYHLLTGNLKINIMRKIVYILSIALFFNCGSVIKYKRNDIKPLNDIKKIEGEYQNYSVADIKKLHHLSLNGIINWRMKHYDSTQFTSIKIKVLNERKMKIDFLLENKVLKSKLVKYRIKNNNFIKLKNNNTRISGIPIIFGEYEMMKVQFGLNMNNDLILCGFNDSAGGILIALSSGVTYDINGIYKRIK